MIKLDLNGVSFQEDLVSLEKPELVAFIKTLRKVRSLTWQQLYVDRGLRWERIHSLGVEAYSIRVTRKCRAIVAREGDILRFISLHPDHDSAYR